jgi:hypothetical protein
MRRARLAFALALAALAAGCRRAPDAATPPARLAVFLLVGQSNMAGRGVVEASDRDTVARVWMLDRSERWVPAIEPAHFDKPIAGVGPGRAFALAVTARDPRLVVGLVPAAVGGSSILAWEPGAEDAATRTHPYDDALRRARAALRHGELAGILWHQGESDASAERAPEYEARLRALVRRLRADLGAPDAPFVVGQLGRFPERPWDAWRERVNAAHEALPRLEPRVAFVSAAGLGHKGDTLHFSAAAARQLGQRYADAWLRLRAAR